MNSEKEKIWLDDREIICVYSKGKVRRLKLSEILYFEVIKHEIYIHIVSVKEQGEKRNEVLNFRDTISDVEKMLKEKEFLRVHTGYLVNLQHMISFDDTEIVLTGNISVKIPKTRVKEVQKKLLEYTKFPWCIEKDKDVLT